MRSGVFFVNYGYRFAEHKRVIETMDQEQTILDYYPEKTDKEHSIPIPI
jgi:hypothetical protein